ncbi:MAG: hypothetical protein L0H53_14670 [Candidatus Nitrosocosmicus sp.]|nr:hypothetical protein [Candidatus Nitrosocosmicus sp.]MDN5868645.1 hypothetical protein [Candidatus Nitrosocosmicus sp.]
MLLNRSLVENGFLLDIYHLKDKMILWAKAEDIDFVNRLECTWSPFIYVTSNTKSELDSLLKDNNLISYFVKNYSYECEYEYP